MRILLLITILLLTAVTLFAAKKLPPLTTVDKVDLTRYAGLWYQIAYFPNSFQPGDAKLTTAEYGLHPKGYITVVNTSYKDAEGKKAGSKIKGKAFIADKVNNSKLRVQFFWPFRGDYWITLLDKENYQWVAVSEPKRKYLWIMNREPFMDNELYQDIVLQLKNKYIDTDKIVITGRID